MQLISQYLYRAGDETGADFAGSDVLTNGDEAGTTRKAVELPGLGDISCCLIAREENVNTGIKSGHPPY